MILLWLSFYITSQVYVETEGEKPKKGDTAKQHEFEISHSTITHTFANKSDIPKYEYL